MPPRDEQEWEKRRQQIIEGALRVFSRKGFERATNREIAEEAGIGSPGLIYHYFQDKRDLFAQVLETRAPALHVILHSDGLMELPPREALRQFGEGYLQALAQPGFVKLFRLMLGEAMRRPQVAEMINEIGPLRALDLLQRYLGQQMELGTLRTMDPRLAARCFIGPLMVYFLTREVFVQPDAERLHTDEMLDAALDIFLRGMAPEEGEP